MGIFDVTDQGPTLETTVQGWLKEANVKLDKLIAEIYDDVQRFWYRNKDANGNPSAVKHDATEDWGGSDEWTGPEFLEAMGPAALPFLSVAYARAEMIQTMSAQLGIDGLDMAKVLPPYDLTWHEDGSLDTATLKA